MAKRISYPPDEVYNRLFAKLDENNGHVEVDEPVESFAMSVLKVPSVYVVKSGRYTKIGHTTGSVYDRIAGMKTGNPYKIRVVCVLRTEYCKSIEKLLHRAYKEKNVRGEWFALSKRDLGVINQAFKNHIEYVRSR